MLFIGITGGVGAGKSTILEYLSGIPGVRLLVADEIAHDLMEPGTECYLQLRAAFQDPLLYLADGHFNRPEVARLIFRNKETLKTFNRIVHPAVKRYIISEAEKAREDRSLKLLVLEAALLIEEGYDKICDELWYIYVTEEIRTKRLMASRGYSKEKCQTIINAQLPDREFRAKCREIIDNNGNPEDTREQIHQILLARGICSGL